MTDLELSIHRTLRYFDLFDQPLTATQLWRLLILPSEEHSLRWDGHRLWQLSEVRNVLQTSDWLRQRAGSKWGYYYLKGRESIVCQWLRRHALAQDKWKLTVRLVRWLTPVPFVRMIAMSGSLAEGNVRPNSDLDLFIIVRHGRIWLARLFVLIVAQMTGRRRKYWNRQAPDKLCLNHYVTDSHPVISPEIRNVYTSVLYRHLIPLYGVSVFRRFQQANAGWLKQYVMYPTPLFIWSPYLIRTPWWLRTLKHKAERALSEPLTDIFEILAERVQRNLVMNHALPGQGGRVALSSTELAFHPNSKVPRILERFGQDEGQKQLLS